MRKYGLYGAWVLACLGVLVSLYFSAILHKEPCALCWYQRIALFPLALILGVATYTADHKAIRYALPLAIFGILIALYQIAIQEIPSFDPITLCGAGPDCSEKFYVIGKITVPMLSALDFGAIATLLCIKSN